MTDESDDDTGKVIVLHKLTWRSEGIKTSTDLSPLSPSLNKRPYDPWHSPPAEVDLPKTSWSFCHSTTSEGKYQLWSQ